MVDEPKTQAGQGAAALDEIASQGGGHVHFWVPLPTPADDAVAERLGLRRGRDLYQMRRPLPSGMPPRSRASGPGGIVARSARCPVDSD